MLGCELHAILEDQGWGALQQCTEHEVMFELFWHDGAELCLRGAAMLGSVNIGTYACVCV